MTLEKNKSYGDPFVFDMSGIRFIMEGDRFDALKVFSLFEPSPAAEAGLREGDIVKKIDGRDASRFNRETLREYLERDGKEVRFEIERGEETKKISFRLRTLV
jgi:C-terminal processing protease CtpA/Prc